MHILYLANIRLPTEKAHGVQIMKMCEAFAALGHEVTLAVTDRVSGAGDDPFAYYKVERTFSIVRLPVLDWVRFGRFGFLVESCSFAWAAWRYARRHPADVIFSRDETPLWPLTLTRKPFIWESHDGAWNALARRAARKSKAMVVVSQGLKDFYVERGIAAAKIHVAPNGIDPDEFAAAQSKEGSRRRLGLPSHAKMAMYIGRLDGWKGADTLLAASELLPEDVILCVIGGEEAQVAAARARYPRVHFLGYRPYRELPDNQAAADVLVVPNTGKNLISARFTSPLKLLAHLAAGRAIVASDLPSIRELGGDAVRYVPADDPQALAAAIVELCHDDAAAEALAAKARDRARGLSWQNRARGIASHIGL